MELRSYIATIERAVNTYLKSDKSIIRLGRFKPIPPEIREHILGILDSKFSISPTPEDLRCVSELYSIGFYPTLCTPETIASLDQYLCELQSKYKQELQRQTQGSPFPLAPSLGTFALPDSRHQLFAVDTPLSLESTLCTLSALSTTVRGELHVARNYS